MHLRGLPANDSTKIYSAYTNTSTWQNQALGMSYLAVTRPRGNMDFLLENFALKQIRILQVSWTFATPVSFQRTRIDRKQKLLYALDKRVTLP